MSEMVEKVARAIAADASEYHAKRLPTDRQLTELDELAIGDGCIWPVELARAAIEAMREYGHEVGTRRMWQELFPPPPEMSA